MKKTWTLLDLAVSVTAGIPWMGLRTHQGPVLYVNFEVAEPFFTDRLRTVAAARGIEIPDGFHVWNLRGMATNADNLPPRLAKEMQGLKPVLIIIDPIYKLMGGTAENDAAAVTALCNQIEILAISTGAAVVFAAHFSKGNQASKDALDRISGSGVFARDPDAILIMTKHSEDGCLTVETILRNCPEMPSFVVEWSYPLMIRREDLDPAELKVAPGPGQKASSFSANDLFEVLDVGQTIKPTAWQRLSQESIGIGPTRFWEIISSLRVKGSPKISHTKENGWTRLA